MSISQVVLRLISGYETSHRIGLTLLAWGHVTANNNSKPTQKNNKNYIIPACGFYFIQN